MASASSQIYTLSLHDALPISRVREFTRQVLDLSEMTVKPLLQLRQRNVRDEAAVKALRSEEHTSELQSLTNLVCRLLLEKKKKKKNTYQRVQCNTDYTSSHSK